MVEKRIINRFQLWLLIVNFQIGSALIFTPSKAVGEAKQDGWISLIAVILIGSLFILLTVTLSNRHQYQSIVDISKTLFGKSIGFIVGIMYAWFYIHLAAILLREMGDMMKGTTLPETPLLVLIAMYAFIIYLATFYGVETIARLTELFAPYAFIGLWLTILLVIPLMKLERVQPILSEGLKPILKGAFPVVGFTFAEMAIFFMILPFVNNRKNLVKIVISGGIAASFTLLVMVLASIMVLGVRATGFSIFAPINVARLINVGDFLTRVEILINMSYVITIFIKVTVTFYAGVIATAQVFNLSSYRSITLPLVIIIISLSLVLSEGIVEFLDYTSTAWTPYAMFFSLVLPLFLLIISLIRGKQSRGEK